MLNRFTCLLFILCFLSLHTVAQRLGQWRTHFSYGNTLDLAETPERIYVASTGGLYFVEKADNSINILSKIDGLSDNIITKLGYSTETQTLIVVYDNTNIDLIRNEEIINIPDIFLKQILGKKYINSVFCNGKFAYLATGFAIIVIDLEKIEVKDTYNLGLNGLPLEIFQVTTKGNEIFACTENGIYQSELTNPFLTNVNEWTKHSGIQNVPTDAAKNILTFAGKIYGLFNEKVFRFENNTWSLAPFFADGAELIRANNNTISTIAEYGVFVYDDKEANIFNVQDELGTFKNIRTALVMNDRKVWLGNKITGLSRFNNPGVEMFPLKGPAFIGIGDIVSKNKKLILVPGGRNLIYSPLFNQEGFSIFDGDSWTSNSKSTDPLLNLFDFNAVEIDPTNPEIFYAGTFGNGLVKFQDNKVIQIFNAKNSSLRGPTTDTLNARVSSMAIDANRNVWVSNHLATKPISVIRPNGTSTSYSIPQVNSDRDVREIIVDAFDQKWVVNKQSGVVVFDEKKKDNNGNILSKQLSVNDGLIESSNEVLCLVSDLDGAVWVGTTKGLVVYYDPGSILTGGQTQGQQIKIVQNGFVQFLLGTEIITSMAIDGANRKWIGTFNGVWLFSPDGTEVIHNFTKENSPLPGNEIKYITVDGASGEVFFGTDAGLISYKSTATEGGLENKSVLVYPNPVRESFAGDIAISGLVKDANIKITDVSGNLVYQTVALGGQAIWNGKDFNNKKVSTGVYMVFASNDDGLQTIVSKILFIN